MLLEALAAGVVGLVVLWLVFEPLLLRRTAGAELIEPEDPDETPRGQALLALKEIEFDRETGKLSDEDYATLKTRYTARAVELLRAEEQVVTQQEDRLEALIAARARAIAAPAATDGAPVCSTCGPRPEATAVFCSGCGMALLPVGACGACAAPLPGDAKFCTACGTPARTLAPPRA